MAEMPERPFYAGDGIAGRDGHERQTIAAGDENTGTRKDVVASVTMEEVLRTENVCPRSDCDDLRWSGCWLDIGGQRVTGRQTSEGSAAPSPRGS